MFRKAGPWSLATVLYKKNWRHTGKFLFHDRNQRIRRTEIHLCDGFDNVCRCYRPSTPCYRLVVSPIPLSAFRLFSLFFFSLGCGDSGLTPQLKMDQMVSPSPLRKPDGEAQETY